ESFSFLRSEQRQLAAFEFQQPFLQRESASKPGQIPVIPNDAMARNDDRNRICAVRRSHGTNRPRLADPSSEILVRNRCAVRNILQLFPNRLLKIRSFRDQRQRKSLAVAREILAQLPDDVIEKRTVFGPI